MNMEFISNEKSKPIILMNGYKFCFDKMLSNDKCSQKHIDIKFRSNGTRKPKKNQKISIYERSYEQINEYQITRYQFLKTTCFKILPRAN